MKLTGKQKAIVGPWIENERQQQGLTKKDLYSRAGVGSPMTYARLIDPKDSVEPNQTTVEAVMVALGYTADSWKAILEGGDPEPSTDVPAGEREDVLLSEIRDMKASVQRMEEASLNVFAGLGELIGLDALRRIQEARTRIQDGGVG